MFNLKKLQVTTQLIICLFSPAAFAVDGVLEINHTCATQLGCFSDDTVGYPITIDGSAGRSYRLSSDLIVPDANTNGIEVNTSSVSIDLNGFEIVRSGCEGATTDCKPEVGSSGTGIKGDNYGISLRNGSVTGMGYGIQLGSTLGDQAVVKNLRVRWNRIHGIQVGTGAIVSGNSVYANGGKGILAGNGAIISGNTISTNGEDGINSSAFSVITANSVSDNGARTILDKNYGILVGPGSIVQNNTASFNTGYGLAFTGPSGYRGNVVVANVQGTIKGTGIDLGGNLCGTDDTCP